MLMMAVGIVIELLMSFLLVQYKITVVNTLGYIYGLAAKPYGETNHGSEKASYNLNLDICQLIQIATVTNASFSFLVFLFGTHAVCSSKVTSIQIYQVMLMVSIFVEVMLSYLTVVNLLLFFIKCLTYICVRWVLNALFTVLVIPNDLDE